MLKPSIALRLRHEERLTHHVFKVFNRCRYCENWEWTAENRRQVGHVCDSCQCYVELVQSSVDLQQNRLRDEELGDYYAAFAFYNDNGRYFRVFNCRKCGSKKVHEDSAAIHVQVCQMPSIVKEKFVFCSNFEVGCWKAFPSRELMLRHARHDCYYRYFDLRKYLYCNATTIANRFRRSYLLEFSSMRNCDRHLTRVFHFSARPVPIAPN